MNVLKKLFIFVTALTICTKTTCGTPMANITLTEWTQLCFQFPEFNHVVKNIADFPPPIIEPADLIQLLEAYTAACFHNYFFAANPNIIQNQNKPNPEYFAEEIILNSGYVAVFGDLHGSVHSLTRNLWQLIKDPNIHMDNNFKVASDARIVFTGDNIDRGHYSIETLALIARLYIANPDKVFLVRGNHEHSAIGDYQRRQFSADPNYSYTFFEELNRKYQNTEQNETLKNLFNTLMQTMPIIISLQAGTEESSYNILFCHGGIPVYFNEEPGPEEDKISVQSEQNSTYNITAASAESFTSSDFLQPGLTNADFLPNLYRGNACFADVRRATKWISETESNLIIRGHQHDRYGVKLLFKNKKELYRYLSMKTKNYIDTFLQSHELSIQQVNGINQEILIQDLVNKFVEFGRTHLTDLNKETLESQADCLYRMAPNILRSLKTKDRVSRKTIEKIKNEFAYETSIPFNIENSFFEMITGGDQSYKYPTNWRDVAGYDECNQSELNVNNHAPIITMSSATEGVVLTGDTVGVLHITPTMQDCRFKIHETNFYSYSGMPFPNQALTQMYSSISEIDGCNFTSIRVLHEDEPSQIPVSQGLIDKAIANNR